MLRYKADRCCSWSEEGNPLRGYIVWGGGGRRSLSPAVTAGTTVTRLTGVKSRFGKRLGINETSRVPRGE